MAARAPLAVCLLLSAAGAGCLRNLNAQDAYRVSLKEDFEATAFRISLPEAKMRLLALRQSGPDRACAPCVFTDVCGMKTCRFRFGSSLEDEACLLATEEPYGILTFKVTCGDPWRVEDTVREAWLALDPASFEAADAKAQAALARVSVKEAKAFSPRFGLTGGVYGAVGAANVGLGARVGVRRWHDPNLLSGALLDYEWTDYEIPPAPVGQDHRGHQLSLLLRAEAAPWSPFSARTALPTASVYLLGGATLALDGDRRPGTGYGWRFGLGAHATRYTRSVSLPFFVEAHVQRLFFLPFEATSVRVLVGLGF